MALVLDHLMWGAPSLAAGVEVAERLFGVAPAPGGSHPGRGTCNALLSLGDTAYLEIIAPDPEQSDKGKFAGQLAMLAEPTLITWAAGSSDLQAVAAAAMHCGLQAAGPTPTQRATPQGEVLNWELLFLRGHAFAGLLPFFINWLECIHPATVNPQAGTLQSVTLRSPQAAELTSLCAALDLAVAVLPAALPSIRATVATAQGQVTLSSTPESLLLRF